MAAQHNGVSQELFVEHALHVKQHASLPLFVSEPTAQIVIDRAGICPRSQDLDEIGGGSCIVAERVAHQADREQARARKVSC